MTTSVPWLSVGAVLAGLAVAAGAFAAHALDHSFAARYRDAPLKEVAGWQVPASWKYLQDFKTGAEYQMYHALALVAVGIAARAVKSRLLDFAGWSFLVGIVLFSGSLYFLVGWGMLAWAAFW